MSVELCGCCGGLGRVSNDQWVISASGEPTKVAVFVDNCPRCYGDGVEPPDEGDMIDDVDELADDVDESGHSLLAAMEKARSIGTLELQWLMTVEAEARELAKQLETEKARLPYAALQSLKRLRKLLKDGSE